MDFPDLNEWLFTKLNIDYAKMPLPSDIDSQISLLVRSWLTLEEPARIAALARVSEEHTYLLIGYSARMATLAVREHEAEYILLGLVALGLDGWCGDWRNNALVVPLHYDAARRIGLSPDHIFEEAASVLPSSPADFLRSFLHRTEEDKSIEAMGYSVSADANGFLYVRLW